MMNEHTLNDGDRPVVTDWYSCRPVTHGYDAFGRFSTVAVSNGPTFGYSYVSCSPLLAGYTNTLGLSVTYAYEPLRDHTTLVSNAWGTNVVSTFKIKGTPELP